MRATTQYDLTLGDARTILALVRAGTLGEAAQRLGIDASTIFRLVQGIERGVGQGLFERSRTGYRPTALGLQLAWHAERIETELAAARSTVQASSDRVSGSVHVTTTDTVLYGLVLPALHDLVVLHPSLAFELTATNSLASLTKRDADIAVRATRRAPDHLVGKHVGPLQIAVFASKASGIRASDPDAVAHCDLAAPDSSLGDHPSVVWRRRHCPTVEPRYKTNSVMAVMEMVARGFGVGIIPVFLARGRDDLVQLTPPL